MKVIIVSVVIVITVALVFAINSDIREMFREMFNENFIRWLLTGVVVTGCVFVVRKILRKK